MEISERNRAIVAARDTDQMRWSDIARRFNVSPKRVKQIYVRSAAMLKRIHGDGLTVGTANLSVRTTNALKHAGFTEATTKAEIQAQLPRLRVAVRSGQPLQIKNFGRHSFAEIEAWVGQPDTISIYDLGSGAIGFLEARICELEAKIAALQADRVKAEQLIADVLDEYRDELGKVACDRCEQCGELVMCSFHSLLSALAGHTWTNGAIERARLGGR